ncbi:23S rRNA m(2)A-2503 methyltransferase [Desulfacinum hydrothermale DSM 13146]|uniref:Probable dual-specificity RNA methyltransferase RlmN n=1 Tax=Desulfacinum hydrothermale DSM 13146 TaxID=1121390 RepID=A0A1W1X2I3_9BACT|nr:23S rRNA (adenine(2503)-C(2))-methyltransferase RlmN [Desulfacinum hydrothermale]SMC18152.1 23S rRNA m(2)A-2503 methyltransferase [Desulfacinum hydrothermale DSM 13146]
MERIFIKDYPIDELEAWVESIGERRFRARQIFRHVYGRSVRSWDECTDLAKTFRTQLEFGTYLDALSLVKTQEAEDGTRKFLFRLHDGHHIESVLIPDPPRNTLCVSSQVGCALGCRFCLTGTLGLTRNLMTAEIVDQVIQVQHHLGKEGRLTNIVFMGMGEPLANYRQVIRALKILLDPKGLGFSHRRITLSTAGLVPKMRQLGEESPVNLAVSLHAADNETRDRLMPINRTYPLEELMQACRHYPMPSRKRITFEYILIRDVNDRAEDARRLLKLLSGVRAKVNLIPFNPHPALAFQTPPEERILAFQEILKNAHVTATIRQSRGADIRAACGQLAAQVVSS